MNRLVRSGVAAILFLASLVALGCGSDSKKGPELSSPPPGERVRPGEGGGPGKEPGGSTSNKLTPSGPHAAGMKAFNDQNCGNCHTVEAGGRSKSPNLSQVGKEHDAAWLAAHIKNPKSHKPMSKMPSFEGKINDADLKALSEYLASLK